MDQRRNGKKRNSALKRDENYRSSVTDGMVASLKSISPGLPSDGHEQMFAVAPLLPQRIGAPQ
jgi:hypothetical protein